MSYQWDTHLSKGRIMTTSIKPSWTVGIASLLEIGVAPAEKHSTSFKDFCKWTRENA